MEATAGGDTLQLRGAVTIHSHVVFSFLEPRGVLMGIIAADDNVIRHWDAALLHGAATVDPQQQQGTTMEYTDNSNSDATQNV
jgi:hypothetical protein